MKFLHFVYLEFRTPELINPRTPELINSAHVILTVDRGYESYNLIAQLQRKNMRFVIRAKDFTSPKCILSSFKDEYPDTPEFDVEIKRFITRSRNKVQMTQPSVYLEHKADKTFDYASAHATGKDRLCFISFRVVRIRLSDGNYECIITNLPAHEFPPDRIKEIYHMRWGIDILHGRIIIHHGCPPHPFFQKYQRDSGYP